MSEIKEGILSPQHVQSFLATSAGYLGRRPEANRPAQEDGLFASPLSAAGCRGLREGSNSGAAS